MTVDLHSVQGKVLIAVWILFLPQESQSGCVFGVNNTQDLVLRNVTILREMNDTLMFHLNATTMSVRKFNPYFSLSNRLLKWHGVTSGNMLQFTKDGKLLNLTWVDETADIVLTTIKLPAFLITDFVKPVHEALQNISVQYSFSYGIFRPKTKQLHFAGFQNSETLDMSCYAGTYLGFNMSVRQQYKDIIGNENSTQFATLATSIELAIDTHLRAANSPFTNDFVRINVLNASLLSDKYNTLVQAELYFLNQSRNWTEVQWRLFGVPSIQYKDSRNNTAFMDIWGYTLFEIFNVPYSTTSTAPNSTTAYTTTAPTSSSTSSNLTTSISTLTTMITNTTTSPALSTGGASTTPVLTNSSTTLSTTSNSTNLTESSSRSTASITASNSSPIFTTSSAVTQSASTSVGSLQSTNASTLSLMQNDSSTSPKTTTALVTLTSITNLSASNFVSISGDSQGTLSVTTISYNNTSTAINSSVNTTPSIKVNGTTYDPDPLFLPVVRVINKVYNDEILLKRNSGKFTPLTERIGLYVVTIPAAIGLIIVIVGCLLCLQWSG